MFSVSGAFAAEFNIPAGDLKAALDSYMSQTGVELIYPEDQMGGSRTKGVAGALAPEDALGRILKGTGFSMHHESGAIAIVRDRSSLNSANEVAPMHLAQASLPARTAVETVTVTSSKLGGANVQSIPISITALSQEQLTSTQTAGGPDLVKQVPNMNFT
ncbi:MAG TPA: STN domain-containing protein, partial [Rhizomicrobium sp.]|nr:STN domain-containing protein [Rhizomicrobium sp.]